MLAFQKFQIPGVDEIIEVKVVVPVPPEVTRLADKLDHSLSDLLFAAQLDGFRWGVLACVGVWVVFKLFQLKRTA